MTRLSYHLAPEPLWDAADRTRPYSAPSLASEGFIHCTDGSAELLRTADRHYRDDPRPFVALTVDLDRVTAAWRIDDPAGIYPHIYGPIDRGAIILITPLLRSSDGRFVGLASAPNESDAAT